MTWLSKCDSCISIIFSDKSLMEADKMSFTATSDTAKVDAEKTSLRRRLWEKTSESRRRFWEKISLVAWREMTSLSRFFVVDNAARLRRKENYFRETKDPSGML